MIPTVEKSNGSSKDFRKIYKKKRAEENRPLMSYEAHEKHFAPVIYSHSKIFEFPVNYSPAVV